MKDLRAQRGRFLIERLLAEGEHERQDFKFAISDARKIARSLSAFANHKGGRLLIGVKDNGTVAGVRSEEDVYMIETAAAVYCRPEPRVSFKAYKATDDGAVVIVAEVAPAGGEMVCVREADGSLRAYVRVADENIMAPDLMVRARSVRHNASYGSGLTLTPGSPAMEVLTALRRIAPCTPGELLRAVHSSRTAASDALVTLLAMEAVALEYRPPNGFLLTI